MQVIKQIGVVSFAKIMAVTSLLLSLIIFVPMGLLMIFAALLGGAGAAQEDVGVGLIGGGLGVGGGLAVMIGAPLTYTVFTFIFGLVYGLIINIVFGLAGGLEVQIEDKKSHY